MLIFIIIVMHVLISFGFFTCTSYRKANSMPSLFKTTFCDSPDYDLETFLSLIFWPIIPITMCGIFIYNLSLYDKFLKFLKKKEKPVQEIDETKSSYRKTVYK